MDDGAKLNIHGHVTIRDKETGEVLVDRDNAIHFENFSNALALSLADRANGHINLMVFGNGGTTVSGTGAITYFPPNVTGQGAQLYNETFSKVVDDQSPLNADPTHCFEQVLHTTNRNYTDVVITCTLEFNEPSGQDAADAAVDPSGNFIFDEIGLKAFNAFPEGGILLSHVVFHPIQKALNRIIEIIYVIRISMV